MSKVHYSQSSYDDIDESYVERAICGVKVGEDYQWDNNWNNVTCKICLKLRANIEQCVSSENEFIANQLGDMADYFKNRN